MTRMLRFFLAAAAMLASASVVRAQLPVFSGDPVDLQGAPYVILPGVPLILAGDDETLGTNDDQVDLGTIGDVDVVARTGGSFAGGAFPPPAAGIAVAPALIAGGQNGGGGEAPFQIIVSDGAASPALGNPLLGSQHDSRAVLVVAFPDLDGDGWIGPYAGDGNTDLQVERQEAFSIIGRQVALIHNGVASGNLALSLGAPASHGGLGVMVGGGVLMGSEAPEYFDGAWVGTRLPILPPLDSADIIGAGGGVRPPPESGEALVEIKTEFEKWLLPAPDDALLGGLFAIPTDGSSPTIDLLRADGGAFNGAALALAIDPATFVADAARRLIPAVDGLNQRHLLEPIDALVLPDDGIGNGRTVVVYSADRFGNATDASSTVVVLEAGAGILITSPDSDSDPLRELLLFDGAAFVTVTVDDAGGANDTVTGQRLTAVIDGVPTGSIEIQTGTAPPTEHDAVVIASRPVAIRIAAGSGSASRTVKIKVRNASATSDTLQLIVNDGDCPAGIAGQLDFDPNTAGAQDTIQLGGGMSAKAALPLQLGAADFISFNHDTPTRCRLQLSVAGSGIDPSPSNNAAPLEISVIDYNDSEQGAVHESFVDSLRPIRVRLTASRPTKLGKSNVRVGNGDLLPQPEVDGHLITVTTEGSCPPNVLGAADFDRSAAGAQSGATIGGGKRRKAALSLTIQAADFSSASADSPARCIAYVRASGPAGDSDPSNDTAVLVIDVF